MNGMYHKRPSRDVTTGNRTVNRKVSTSKKKKKEKRRQLKLFVLNAFVLLIPNFLFLRNLTARKICGLHGQMDGASSFISQK